MKTTQNYRIRDITPKWEIQEPITEQKVTGPESIYEIVSDYYKAKELDPTKEHCICAVLSRSHDVIGFNLVSTGSVSASIVHPREVFKPAISISGSAIILIHNHPSGELLESRQDIEITKTVQEAGEILDIPLLDHIIISFQKKSYKSLKEAGYIND